MIDEDKKNLTEEEKVREELVLAKAKCEEYLNGWKRERADFLNYKKDEMERISELAKYANEKLILKIIPILDNIYLAESHVPASFAEARHLQKNASADAADADAGLLQKTSWLQGFNQIKNQLADFLSKEGIEPIETSGKRFDPNLMEVVEEVKSEGEDSGVVVGETQKGYTMHSKIIRVAKVRITK